LVSSLKYDAGPGGRRLYPHVDFKAGMKAYAGLLDFPG